MAQSFKEYYDDPRGARYFFAALPAAKGQKALEKTPGMQNNRQDIDPFRTGLPGGSMTGAGSEELKALKEEVGRFADRFIRGREELCTSADFPLDIWRQMGAEGLLGLTVPRSYGGRGTGYPAMAAAGEALAARGGNMGMVVSWLIHLAVARFLILGFGTEAQREEWLPRLGSGRATASLAVSEPGSGAHPKRMSTAAVRTGGGYVITGEKAYLTNGPIADLFVVAAVTGESGGRKAFTAFLVSREAPGLVVLKPMDLPFLRPSPHGGIRLEECRVPSSAILGREGAAYGDIIKPFREVEDALMTGPTAGGMENQLERVVTLAGRQRLSPDAAAGAALGRFRILIDCVRLLARETAAMLEGEDDRRGAEGLLLAPRELTAAAQSHLDAFISGSGLKPDEGLNRLTDDIRRSMEIAENVARIKQIMLAEGLLNRECSK
jgi:alkylation response protein AidB-like acyl-CoA dehydrogenase